MRNPLYLALGSFLQVQRVLQHELARELVRADAGVQAAKLQEDLAVMVVIRACMHVCDSGASQRLSQLPPM